MASRIFARDGRRLQSKTGGRRECITKSLSASEGQAGTKDTKDGGEAKTGLLINFNIVKPKSVVKCFIL
jgi:hypothetical protein